MTPTKKYNGVTRRHHMPFGAEAREDGVSFGLWAPDAEQVHLCLEENSGARPVRMERRPQGWHRCFSKEAGVGSRYRYRIDNDVTVPDPASRFQPDGVHGASMVIDPSSWNWRDGEWNGRPLAEAIFYELHVGAFCPEGNYAGVINRLDDLADLGITAIELMPVAAFAGNRNWGYDGVYPFSPAACYGSPDELKALVEAAHSRGLMIFLDVVYNHFGPEGNYLHLYASPFFTDRFKTPWGEAIAFGDTRHRWVRQFFIDNALYWLEEFHFDGLRLDAVHAVFDPSSPSFLEELADAVRDGPGRFRQVHLVLENDNNDADLLMRDKQCRPRFYSAQWNDDMHHAMHVLLTGEKDGYYGDYVEEPADHLGRCLTEGFSYQGQHSAWRGKGRGSPSGCLPSTAFINFLQNHDQTGNRAFGERLTSLADTRALKAATAVLLLSPQLPLLFMGQEWGCSQPFLYFCDFGDDLAPRVRDGRRKEFSGFAAFADQALPESIPDPGAMETFRQCILDWRLAGREPGKAWLDLCRRLISLRKTYIIPRIIRGNITGGYDLKDRDIIMIRWRFFDGAELRLAANYSGRPCSLPCPPGDVLFIGDRTQVTECLHLASRSVAFFLRQPSNPVDQSRA